MTGFQRLWLIGVALLSWTATPSHAQTSTGVVGGRDDTSSYHIRTLLLNFYQETGGLDWKVSTNWFQQGTEFCDWYGVHCYADNYSDERRRGHVQEIVLSDNDLVGTVSSEIFQLPYLERFDVQDNDHLDVELNGLREADFLRFLLISDTAVDSLSGIGSASQLEELHITNLKLRGNLPGELFDLTNLVSLYANYNSFTGRLSTQVGRLTKLNELYLYDSDLTGPLPTELGRLTTIETLILGQNNFNGNLPTEMEYLTQLRTFGIQQESGSEKGDGLEGSLPSFRDFRDIRQMYMENNRFSGSLDPNFLRDAPKQQSVEVDLSGNQLTGSVPGSLFNKAYLTLYLAGNSIQSVSTDLVSAGGNQCPDIQNWMSGDVESVGCGAFLCPPGTWAPEGRATRSASCEACSDDNTFWGRTECDSSTPPSGQERQVLEDLYNNLGGRGWKVDTNWLSDSFGPCDWHGIDCSNGRITEINLADNGLSGGEFSDIFSLPELRVLNLRSNSIRFRFNGISAATKLETLDVGQTDSNDLSGVSEAASLPSLRSLTISFSNFDGPIPDDLFSLRNLEELNILGNRFSGKVPASIGQMANLRRFDCSGNRLTGQIPTNVGQLVLLEEFWSAENQFEGTLPTQFDSLSRLRTLSLHQSKFSGGIGGPLPSFRNMEELTSLQLQANRLTGDLPADLLQNSRRLNQRIELLLGDNEFTGGIPRDWTRFQNLFVDLSENRLSDNIDGSLCKNDNWMDGEVADLGCDAILCPKGKYSETGRRSSLSTCIGCSGGNYLGATECESTGDGTDDSELEVLNDFFLSTNGNGWNDKRGWSTTTVDYCNDYVGVYCDAGGRVIRLDLANNGLTGSTSTSIFNLPRLQEINLSGNAVRFSFNGIENAKNLVTLDLSNTDIDSVDGIAKATSLITLRLSDNGLVGAVPEDIFALTGLRELEMNHNQFNGRVPADFRSMTELETLHLYHNQFSGQLPAALGELTLLRELDLSENNFDGTIPTQYSQMRNLMFLSLQREGGFFGDNDVGGRPVESSAQGPGLSGPLPDLAGLENIRELYLGLNSLSGSVPYNFLDGVRDKTARIKVDLTSNRISGELPASLTQFDRLTIYLGGNLITSIPDAICNRGGWMDNKVASFQCSAILCPVNFYSPYGRRFDQAGSCQSCSIGTNGVMGSFECLSSEDHQDNGERAILETLYRQMDGENWFFQANWMDSEESVCDWYGITCVSDDDESVYAIDLSSNGLQGPFVTEIYSLPSLRELTLQGNSIMFSFDGIGNSNLDLLDIEDTGTASLDGVQSASTLTRLRVDGNQLSSFPSQVFSLNNLEVLSLNDNPFAAQAMPNGITSLDKLRYFACSECSFTGAFPSWIDSLQQLEYIRLDQNEFLGPLPTELENLPKLRHLDLADQVSNKGRINGSLLSFSTQQFLTEIFLQHNYITGQVPPDFLLGVGDNGPVTVDLSFNTMSGPIPAELARLSGAEFNLAGNNINLIPDAICQSDWNDGNAITHGCDGILCDKGTWNSYGRAIGELGCFPCDAPRDVFGATFCGTNFEHTALVFFYRSLGGSNWNDDSNWLRDENHCNWVGITCHTEGEFENLVKSIDLSDNNLSGQETGLVFQLKGLVSLNLKKNDIKISLSQISNAQYLEELILSETSVDSLTGIGGASNLKRLHITNAQLSGPIPLELWQLTGLEELYLSYNDFIGPLSTWIGSFRNLRDLYLFGNKLSGNLPSELGQMTRIEHMSLGENRFQGSIPVEIMNLPFLEILSLQNEEAEPCLSTFCSGTGTPGGLSGPLPSFDGLPRLRQLFLGHNRFQGNISPFFLNGITDTDAEITVDISDNALEGQLPTQLADFRRLRLFAADNKLTGTVPNELCQRGEWMEGAVSAFGCDAILCPIGTFNEYGRHVDESSECRICNYPGSAIYLGSMECGPVGINQFGDSDMLEEFFDAAGGSNWKNKGGWKDDGTPICEWHGISCEAEGPQGQLTVTAIELDDNNLEGYITSVIFHLPALKKLSVRNNNVEIGFGAIDRAPELEELYLDGTKVESLYGISEAPKLRTLHLRDNDLVGVQIPDELFQLESLVDLDLTNSKLFGSLSTRIGLLSNLQILRLDGNELNGIIPSEIGELTDLRTLSLSDNNFYGPLPDTINELRSLENLLIDNSKRTTVGLTGSLKSFSTMSSLRVLHLHGNQLTGVIPDNFLGGIVDLTAVLEVRLEGNHIVGTVPSSLSKFAKLNIELADNLIVGIGDGLCLQSDWLDGDVGRYDCDGLLCPAGQYSSQGRQTSDSDKCEPCPGDESSPYFGVSVCIAIQKMKEKELLTSLYKSTNGDNWRNRAGWLNDDVDVCDWFGVSCLDGKTVISVALDGNNLTGKVPSDIFSLPNLETLWLYSNPVEFTFDGIENASRLTSLLVSATRTTSLGGVGKAAALQELDVRFNNMAGSFPEAEFEGLSNLRSLSVADNDFSGKIPSFSRNIRLESVRLGDNDFDGDLPSYSWLTQLKTLEISNNRVEGSIPTDLLQKVDAAASIFVDLSGNELTGTIPKDLGRFQDLTIYVRNNRIEGIDEELCSQGNWNGGDVGRFQCDGILCPSGTSSISGRASKDGIACEPCNKNDFFGGSTCGSSGSGRLLGHALVAFVTVLATLLACL